MKITIGIADDHQLFLGSLGILIESFGDFEVVAGAPDGQTLLETINRLPFAPDIVLVDVNMPVMNGIETVRQLIAEYPLIRVAALSMKEDDATIISMLRAGCCAYLFKDMNPHDLHRALLAINEKGYYNAGKVNNDHRRKAREQDEIIFSPKEIKFLELASSDKTYKQIAAEMKMAARTIDGYRETLFEKLNVESRVGMVLEAMRRNLVHM